MIILLKRLQILPASAPSSARLPATTTATSTTTTTTAVKKRIRTLKKAKLSISQSSIEQN